jgi:hypothetical protein
MKSNRTKRTPEERKETTSVRFVVNVHATSLDDLPILELRGHH